jgi:hypothetical protein
VDYEEFYAREQYLACSFSFIVDFSRDSGPVQARACLPSGSSSGSILPSGSSSGSVLSPGPSPDIPPDAIHSYVPSNSIHSHKSSDSIDPGAQLYAGNAFQREHFYPASLSKRYYLYPAYLYSRCLLVFYWQHLCQRRSREVQQRGYHLHSPCLFGQHEFHPVNLNFYSRQHLHSWISCFYGQQLQHPAEQFA